MSSRKLGKILVFAIGLLGLTMGNVSLINTAHASGIESDYDSTRNTEYRLDGNSIVVYIENGGTVTIVDRLDVARVMLGTLLYSNIEIINNSYISDLEFSENVVRGYIFGQHGITSLVNSGIVTWGELSTDEFGGGDAANPAQNIRHTFDGRSVMVHLEDGSTVIIVDKTEVVSAVLGTMSFWDIEIINESNISDTEFLAGLGRGHIFGYGGLSALSRAGFLENDPTQQSEMQTNTSMGNSDLLIGVWESTDNLYTVRINQDGSIVSNFGGFSVNGTWSVYEDLITITKTVEIGSVASTSTGTNRFVVTADNLRWYNQDGTYDDFVRAH